MVHKRTSPRLFEDLDGQSGRTTSTEHAILNAGGVGGARNTNSQTTQGAKRKEEINKHTQTKLSLHAPRQIMPALKPIIDR